MMMKREDQEKLGRSRKKGTRRSSRSRMLVAGLVLLGVAVGFTPGADATTYIFTDVNVPGGTETHPRKINGAGQIVGAYLDGSGVLHGFLDTAGTFSTITVPGAVATNAFGINNAGQIVGAYLDGSDVMHGYLDSAGTFSTINYPGATGTLAAGINDTEQIVGAYVDASGVVHGFLDSAGTFSTITVPGATDTLAVGINDTEQIVGASGSSATLNLTTTGLHIHLIGDQGYLDSGGTFSTINYPGAVTTDAFGINNAEQIVGEYTLTSDPLNVFHGFLDTGGTLSTFDAPGGTSTETFGINDTGQIVGFTNIGSVGSSSLGTESGFLATPVTSGVGGGGGGGGGGGVGHA